MANNRTWEPFSEMMSLRDAMAQLMEGSVIRPGTFALNAAAQMASSFPINVHGTPDELKVEALLPGISEEDVRVDIDRGVLTISAKRQGQDPVQGEQWHLREFNPGQFSRSLSLPFPVEAERSTATFANGVLTLVLPKAEAAKPRRIQIGSSQRHEQLASAAQ